MLGSLQRQQLAQDPQVQNSQLWGVAYNKEALRPGGVVAHILPNDGSGGLQLCGPQAKVLHDGLSVRPGVVVLRVCCQTGSRVVQLLQSRLQAMSLMLGRKHWPGPKRISRCYQQTGSLLQQIESIWLQAYGTPDHTASTRQAVHQRLRGIYHAWMSSDNTAASISPNASLVWRVDREGAWGSHTTSTGVKRRLLSGPGQRRV